MPPWFGFSKDAGANIRATNLLVAVWFALFSIPLFLFGKTRDPVSESGASQIVKKGLADFGATFKEIQKYREIVKLLIARMIYNDGLVTIFAFGGIYAAGTFGFTFQEIMIFGIGINVAAGIGALAMGIFSGPNQSASRSLMGRMVPREKENQFFGFYAFSGKLTAFWGPLLLGVLTQMFDSQRVGLSAVILFFVVGGLLLSRVDETAGINLSC